MKLKVQRRELNTIIAALRYYQEFLVSGRQPNDDQMRMVADIAGDGEMKGNEPLSPEDIDDLCERING